MHSAAPDPVLSGGCAPPQRFHGLDWLRAVAALLVVALHAGIAYTLSPFPGLAWPTHDPHPSAIVDALTWWIDGWIMPAFLIMGGFVAAPLLDRLGPATFIRHRARRLLLPLLFGCLVILPLDFYIWLLGWVIDDRIPIKKLRSLKLGPEGDGLWGVAHLWFLQYLFLFSLAAAALAALKKPGFGANQEKATSNPPLSHASRSRPDVSAIAGQGPGVREVVSPLHVSAGRTQRVAPFRSPAAWIQTVISLLVPLLFAIPGALILAWQPRIVIGFRHSGYPLAANLLYYAPCFAAGWWLARRTQSGRDIARPAPLLLALALIVFASWLPLLRQHVVAEWSGLNLLLLTSLFSMSAWFTAWGAVTLSLKPCTAAPAAVRYLSEASLWIYLAHHPAVGLTQVALSHAPLAAAAKFGLVFAAATSLSLLTYEAFVRRTWLGTLLNGGRRPHNSSASVVDYSTGFRSAA